LGAEILLRIVFDTNVILSALIHSRRLLWVPALWSSGVVQPLVCRETVSELLTALHYPKFKLDDEKRADVLDRYLPYADLVSLPDPLPKLPVACRDPRDEKFIHLAIAAGADVLVTGDNDLLALRGTIPVRIVTTAELQTEMEKLKN